VELTVDTDAGAAYVRLNEAAAVARTERFRESVLVDLDTVGAPVGIEILALPAAVDVDGLADRYSLPGAVRAELRLVLGDLVGMLRQLPLAD